MRSEVEPTIWYRIFMAGDYAKAKQVCRRYCGVGLVSWAAIIWAIWRLF